MSWSIISAVIPSLRPFLRGLSTYTEGLGGRTTDPSSQRYPNISSYELSNLRSTASNVNRHQRKSRSVSSNGPGGFLGTKSTGSRNKSVMRARRRGEADDQRSLNSNDSQNMIIEKDVHFTVAWDSSRAN